MKRELVYTKKESEEIIALPDKMLEKALRDKYDFEIGYVPEGFGVAFLLIEDNKEDSRKDVWKIVFYKQSVDVGGKTITLDDVDNDADFLTKLGNNNNYDFFKELPGNFEDVINISVDLIKKYFNTDEAKNESTV
jgi:hypothetical protein